MDSASAPSQTASDVTTAVLTLTAFRCHLRVGKSTSTRSHLANVAGALQNAFAVSSGSNPAIDMERHGLAYN